MIARLIRYAKHPTATLGRFSVMDDGVELGRWLSLELPDKGNKPKISCIPEGSYECVYTFSPAFKKFMYEVKGVPGRAGIRIHAANFAIKQLLGCIALGKMHIDIDKDGSIDVADSRKAIAEFESTTKEQPFNLLITYENKS